MKRTALFAGSFDPFTIGHKSVVERALGSVADEVVVAVGNNVGKHGALTIDERIELIAKAFEGEARVRVACYEGLTVDFARKIGADFLLRGVRSVRDFEAEREMAEVNRQLGGIETVLMLTEPQLAHVSSSVVRELMAHGKDVGSLTPVPLP